MIGIYKITNPKGQIYIGSSKDIESRWKYHTYDTHRTTKIHNSIQDHGPENHCFEVIELCDKKELLKRERYWQEVFLSYKNDNLNSYRANNSIYVNGKRQRVERSKNTFYMDITNGVFYTTIKEISDLYSIKRSTLANKLCGYNPNNTNFIRV